MNAKEHDSNISTMSNTERTNFHGNTIEDPSNSTSKDYYQNGDPQFFQDCAQAEERNRYYQTGSYGGGKKRSGPSIRVMRVNMGLGRKSSWWTRLLWTLGASAVVALFFFLALPIFVAGVGIMLVFWFISQFLKK